MPSTTLATDGERFLIDGALTYAGTQVEGLLFNVRTVNATFDDTLGRVDWFDDDGTREGNGNAGYGPWRSPASAEANTERFIAALPQYREAGILAVNLNLQGGHPLKGMPWIEAGSGSAGRRPNGHRDFYHNSGFDAQGRIDPATAGRIGAVIESCDAVGLVVILQLFYFGQDTALADADAIRAACDHTVDWVCGHGWTNVTLEIANEVMRGHYHHDILKPGKGMVELIERCRRRARERHGRELLVGTSEAALLHERQWTVEQMDAVFSACDIIWIHGGDDVETGRVGDASELVRKVEWLRAREWFSERPRPIATNESDGRAALDAMVQRGVSFGLHSDLWQTMFPPLWGTTAYAQHRWFFERVRELMAG